MELKNIVYDIKRKVRENKPIAAPAIKFSN